MVVKSLQYSAYKKTDVDWLGEIPEQWKLLRLKWTVKYCQNGLWGNEPDGDNDVLCVRVADFDRIRNRVNYPIQTLRSIDKSEIRNHLLRRGDLLIEKSGGGDLQPVGVVVLYDSDKPAICSNFVARMPVKDEFDWNFLCYLHSHLYSIRINVQSIKQNTGIQNLDTTAYLNEKVGIPPLSEQRAIADYLDRETARIDALIAKYQRLIELLEEKRSNQISRLVTGDYINNYNIDNGYHRPWLFPLPTGWARKKIKYTSFMKGRIGYENLRADEYTDEGPLLISSVHFQNGRINWEKCNHVTRERFEMSPEIILRNQDVLFMKDGALMGKLAFVEDLPGDACLNSHILLIRPLRNIYYPKFLFYILMSSVFRAYMEEERKGTTFFGFSEQSMGNFPFSCPPISEQIEICKRIDELFIESTKLLTCINNMINHLQEYRNAIISNAVTGKFAILN